MVIGLAQTTPLFILLGILKIDDLFEMQVLMLTHDCLNGYLPNSLRKLFTFNSSIHGYSTRSNMTMSHGWSSR